MTWPPSNEIQPPADSRPLSVDELLPEQARSLREAQQALWSIVKQNETALNNKDIQEDAPFARPDASRSPRVLLIDGGRGTGKSSLMLTLLDRLSAHRPNASKGAKACRDADEAAYATKKKADTPEEEKRVEEVRSRSIYSESVAKRVLCMPPLDFDPMPPSVPIVAWLLESLRGLVEVVHNNRLEGCISLASLQRGDRVERDLRRGWSELIDAAVAAWENGPDSGQTFAQRTDADRRRLETLTGFGRKLNNALNELFVAIEGSETTCVGRGGVVLIPVDDADMQVRRSPELLHALRLLYHPRLVFILTANWKLLEETLGAYYAGQYAKLYGGPDFELRGDPAYTTFSPRRPDAQSDISKQLLLKTFPPAHHFPQESLSLLDMIQFVGWPESASATLASLKDHPLRTEFDRLWSVSIREFLAQRQHWATITPAPSPAAAKETTLATLTALLTSELRARLNVASPSTSLLAHLQADLHVERIQLTPVYLSVDLTDPNPTLPATGRSIKVLTGFTASLVVNGEPNDDPSFLAKWYWYRYVASQLREEARTTLPIEDWNHAIVNIETGSDTPFSSVEVQSWSNAPTLSASLQERVREAVGATDFRFAHSCQLLNPPKSATSSDSLVLWWLDQNFAGKSELASETPTSPSHSDASEADKTPLEASFSDHSTEFNVASLTLISGSSPISEGTKWQIVRGIAASQQAPLLRDDGTTDLSSPEIQVIQAAAQATRPLPHPRRRSMVALTPDLLVSSRHWYGPGGLFAAFLLSRNESGRMFGMDTWRGKSISLLNLMTEGTGRRVRSYWYTEERSQRPIPLQPLVGVERMLLSSPLETVENICESLSDPTIRSGGEWLTALANLLFNLRWDRRLGPQPTVGYIDGITQYDGPTVVLQLRWLMDESAPGRILGRWAVSTLEAGPQKNENGLNIDDDILAGILGLLDDVAVMPMAGPADRSIEGDESSSAPDEVGAIVTFRTEPPRLQGAVWSCPSYTSFYRLERARQYWPEVHRQAEYGGPESQQTEFDSGTNQLSVILLGWVLLNRAISALDIGEALARQPILGGGIVDLFQQCIEPAAEPEMYADDYERFETWAGLLTPAIERYLGHEYAVVWARRFAGEDEPDGSGSGATNPTHSRTSPRGQSADLPESRARTGEGGMSPDADSDGPVHLRPIQENAPGPSTKGYHAYGLEEDIGAAAKAVNAVKAALSSLTNSHATQFAEEIRSTFASQQAQLAELRNILPLLRPPVDNLLSPDVLKTVQAILQAQTAVPTRLSLPALTAAVSIPRGQHLPDDRVVPPMLIDNRSPNEDDPTDLHRITDTDDSDFSTIANRDAGGDASKPEAPGGPNVVEPRGAKTANSPKQSRTSRKPPKTNKPTAKPVASDGRKPKDKSASVAKQGGSTRATKAELTVQNGSAGAADDTAAPKGFKPNTEPPTEE